MNPTNIKQYMESGAGKGVGLKGTGSQDGTRVEGGQSTSTATPGSGSVTVTPSSTSTNKKNAGTSLQPMDKTPLVLGMMVISFSALGALLL